MVLIRSVAMFMDITVVQAIFISFPVLRHSHQLFIRDYKEGY